MLRFTEGFPLIPDGVVLLTKLVGQGEVFFLHLGQLFQGPRQPAFGGTAYPLQHKVIGVFVQDAAPFADLAVESLAPFGRVEFLIAQVKELRDLINPKILFGEVHDSGPAPGAELDRHQAVKAVVIALPCAHILASREKLRPDKAGLLHALSGY